MNAELQSAALRLQEALDRQEEAHKNGCGVIERIQVGDKVRYARIHLRFVLADLGLCGKEWGS